MKKGVRMKKGILLGVSAFLLGMALIVAGLPASGFAAEAAPKSIKVGVLISMTGPDFQLGGPARTGYEIAADEINKDGGVMVKAYGKKIPLELVILDMETNPEKAIARAEALNTQNVPVAVGTTLVGATAEIFEKNKLPVVSTAMTINAIIDRGFKYFFSLCGVNSDMAPIVFEPLAALPGGMPKKWAFVEEQTDFSMEFFGFAKEVAAKRGVTISYEGRYNMLAPDLTAPLTGARDSGADVLFTFTTPPDAITMLKQSAQLGYKPKAQFFLKAADDPAWGKLGAMGDYAIGCADWHPAMKFPGVKEFNATVKAKTGQISNPNTGPAYAAIKVVAAAIEKAGTLDRAAIRDAISATDMMTVVGHVKFGPKNERIKPVRPVMQWQKGIMELVWPAEQRTKRLVYPIPGR
jgi:branched-chain amino acid transport system substrate-binding protein